MIVGKGQTAINCLRWLLEQGEEVQAVIADTGDTALKERAEAKGVKTFQPKSVNDPSFVSTIKALAPDVIFSIQTRRIFKKDFIDIPPKGIINLHFSLLPRNRGCYPVAWALLNGDTEGGVTMHYIDEGIDTGDVITMWYIDIREDDTAFSLYQRYSTLAFELFEAQYPRIRDGVNGRSKQDESRASYHDLKSIDFTNTTIDWDQPTTTLYNWMRAFIFPHIGPTFKFAETEAEVLECKRYDKKFFEGPPGTFAPHMTGDEDSNINAIIVSTRDGSIEITKFRMKRT